MDSSLYICNVNVKTMELRYSTIIFDLDGTLMDTLVDLAQSTNFALRQSGFPERSIEEIRFFVGNGVRKLIERAVPDGLTGNQLEQVFSDFRTHYAEHCKDHSAPYLGIADMLDELKMAGIKMAIVSNKPDAEVKKLNFEFFSEFINVARGENEAAGISKKPAPDMVLLAMRDLHAVPHETLYVGDSDVDIQTAKSAGISCLSVAWGFRSVSFLKEHGALHIIDSPSQLITFIKG